MSDYDQLTGVKPIYHKGEKFACWKCEANLFELTCDVFAGQIVTVGTFSFVPKQKLLDGDLMVCKLCGNEWFNNSAINAKRVYGVWN